jgi:acetolactate synthase-1/3 small subunit
VERELLVARIEADHLAVDACLAQFRGRLLQRTGSESVVEFTGRADEVDGFLDALRLAGDIVDHARSGIAAIERPLALA